ncbi:MAG: sirohydrochlorin cobaltochelatase [Desulfobacteraceae bacterium 4572_35.2]|nr:MAG: sirohydrochlorin cobaltochelatase [Desulfobacteraceae bacterium 4572_35.2]
MKKIWAILLSTLLLLGCALSASAQDKTAIVLASFGTSYPAALQSLTNIQTKVQKAFPEAKVELAFTSNIIRKIWHERQTDRAFQKAHPEIAKQILYVQGPLATIANLQDAGYRTIYVQPTHIFAGEEFQDLNAYVTGLNSIGTIKERFMPFKTLAIGRPALGAPGDLFPYYEDIHQAAKALASDVALAGKNNQALVYMGHGNEYFSTGSYVELQHTMRAMYPDVPIFIGVVEGFPSPEVVKEKLKEQHIAKVMLKPLMIVAGDHASNDMAGDEEDSWKTQFEQMGINVTPVLKGLGENPAWADIYVNHLQQLIDESSAQ